jgi:hypothetical protein
VKRALLAGLAASCLAFPAGAAAAGRLALFPTPLTSVTSIPPFQPPATALPNVFRPPLAITDVMEVGVGPDGTVVSVTANQRLVVKALGDYRLTVPAPAKDVVAGPGSESSPGLRQGAILWQGFASGHKVLAARATLDPRAAAPALPLRLEISGRSARIANVTGAQASTYTADGDRAQLVGILDSLRSHPDGRNLGQGAYVKVTGRTKPVRIEVSAPLRVTGRIGATKVSLVLGGDRPTTRTIDFSGTPSVSLHVKPVPPASFLRPPRGRTWAEALRLGALPDGRTLFAQAARTSLTLARFRQYQAPLANPDPLGTIAARYVYRSAAAPAPPAPPAQRGSAGMAAWLLALIVAGSVTAAGGLAVLWAHS